MENSENNWIESLNEEQRERVFSAMRRIGEIAGDIGVIMKRYAIAGDMIPVGSCDFDEKLKYYVLNHFLRCLGQGHDPQASLQDSWMQSRKHIADHNRRRINEMEWKRWQAHGDGWLESAFRLILDAVPELAIAWPQKDESLNALDGIKKIRTF